jgi:hypothetical protein
MIINEFDLTTPKETDPLSIADDEIRSIKGAIMDTFKYFDSAFEIKFSDFNKFSTYLNIDETSKVIKLNTPKYVYMNSKRLYVDNNGVVINQNPLPPLGSIIKTVLTLAQLDTLYGVGTFAYLDGSDLNPQGSLKNANITIATAIGTPPDPYIKLMNINQAPPAAPAVDPKRTYFLRQSDTEANIEKLELAKTGKPIGAITSTVVSYTHTHSGNHVHTLSNTFANSDKHGRDSTCCHANLTTSEITTDGPNITTTGSYTHGHTTLSTAGDDETRPRSISLNFFMRIN